MNKIRVALVGLGFGAEFVPIYQNHPKAQLVAICDSSRTKLDQIGETLGIEQRYESYAEVLHNPDIDAVHLVSPIPAHTEMTLAAFDAGKHVACTVPMATSINDCRRIVERQAATGLKYMMMETVVYSREFLYVRDLAESGALGKIQFLQASHQQNMEGWPSYWAGLPPMWYATHCVGPMVTLAGTRAEYVSSFGSGMIRPELVEKYGSPFAIESAHFKFRDSDLSARIYRSLFETARQYRESFDVYGSKLSYEWQLIEDELPVIHAADKAPPEIARHVEVPDFAERLPKEIQCFTKWGTYSPANKPHLSFVQGGGHGGSHPHLVHEFVSALLEDREPFPNALEAAHWTCVGLCAHESAMNGGEIVRLPEFTLD